MLLQIFDILASIHPGRCPGQVSRSLIAKHTTPFGTQAISKGFPNHQPLTWRALVPRPTKLFLLMKI